MPLKDSGRGLPFAIRTYFAGIIARNINVRTGPKPEGSHPLACPVEFFNAIAE
jgi:hypothetical protein